MKAIEIMEATKPLSENAKELGTEKLLLTKNRKPVAALVSLKNINKEMLSLSTNPEFMKIIEKARKEFRSGKKLSMAAMRRELSRTDSNAYHFAAADAAFGGAAELRRWAVESASKPERQRNVPALVVGMNREVNHDLETIASCSHLRVVGLDERRD